MFYTDEKTLKALQKGDVKAFEKIYYLYNGHVFNFIHGMLRESTVAKDLTQDVFVQIWNKRTDIDSANNFEGYLFTVAKNSVYLHLRRKVLFDNYVVKMEPEPEYKEPDVDKILDNKLFEEKITRLIKELPEARRKIFLLYWKSDMNYREIADLLSISDKTVATQVRRTLDFLKDRIGYTAPVLILFILQGLIE